jgi:uncharacterized protein involved in copper resistance
VDIERERKKKFRRLEVRENCDYYFAPDNNVLHGFRGRYSLTIESEYDLRIAIRLPWIDGLYLVQGTVKVT